jgi:multidrug resistance efflux pump
MDRRTRYALRQINAKLNAILEKEDMIMATEAELDQAITDLNTAISENFDAANALIAKIGDQPDLADEVAALQQAQTNLQGTTGNLSTAAGTPAEPPPA